MAPHAIRTPDTPTPPEGKPGQPQTAPPAPAASRRPTALSAAGIAPKRMSGARHRRGRAPAVPAGESAAGVREPLRVGWVVAGPSSTAHRMFNVEEAATIVTRGHNLGPCLGVTPQFIWRDRGRTEPGSGPAPFKRGGGVHGEGGEGGPAPPPPPAQPVRFQKLSLVRPS